MRARPLLRGPLRIPHGRMGLALLVVGEILIAIRLRPFSDFYFPFVWVGFTLLLDAGSYAHAGRSLFASHRRKFFGLFALSTVFWWFFELLNLSVRNWQYVGADPYRGVGYVVFATIDFATVLAAVWCSAALVYGLLPGGGTEAADSGKRHTLSKHTGTPGFPMVKRPAGGALITMLAIAPVTLILPLIYPRYTFGLIWLSLLFLFDPINAWCGRPAIITSIVRREWRLPVAFALGTLICGFCWEAWNFWSLPKWVYHVPYVGFGHVFEMPILGYSGYLPFGLEIFAMTNFFLPLLGLGTLTLESVAVPVAADDGECAS